MTQLHNKVNKKELKEKLKEESKIRKTLSFYRYFHLDNPYVYRDELYILLNSIGVYGRIYLAKEGINAQISVPIEQWNMFEDILNNDKMLNRVPLKTAIEDNGKSFYKLIIKVKEKIVADGLDDNLFDVTKSGKHLSPIEFNNEMEKSDSIIVDMRNHYESEVGHFKGAICPDVDTFKEELPVVLNLLKDKKETKILLYCTGGIRCEKASAYLKHHGFKDVNQLEGGIINYAQSVNNNGIKNNFIGKNFVFDERLGERITDDIISNCHQCGKPSDAHTNCANEDCHLLFIQCNECSEKLNGCCSIKCQGITNLSIEEQRKLRKGKQKKNAHAVYKKGRIRPKL